MARNRHSVATTRWIITGILLFVGAFVLSFGVGRGQRVIMVIGGTAIVLGIASRYATRFRRNPRRWIDGTGQVVQVSDPPEGTRFARCTMQVVIDVPGMPAETVLVRDPRVPVVLWPAVGNELPIQVAADDAHTVRVRWKSYAPATGEPADLHEVDADELDDPADHGSGGVPGDEADPDGAIDFDLDGPPTRNPAPTQRTAAPGSPVAPTAEPRVPRPRPGPRTGRRPSPHPRKAVPVAVGAADGDTAPVAAPDPLATPYPSAHPGPAGAIHGLSVTVLVTDLDRSAVFYRDRLGFHEVDSGEGNVVLATGETRLVLRRETQIGTVNRRLVHLNLEVTDIEAVYADLRAASVRFLYPPRVVNRSSRLELWAAAFRDPDGHGIALTQWRPRHPVGD